MPFAEFRCGNVPILSNSGYGIATGGSWKVSDTWNTDLLTEKMNQKGKQNAELMDDSPNIFAIAALAAALFGIIIAFTNVSWRSTAAMCAGILGALMLLGLLIQLRIELKSEMAKGGDDNKSGFNMNGIIKLQFTVWYYFSLVLFLMAAFLHYMRDKLALREAMASAVDFEFQQKEVEG